MRPAHLDPHDPKARALLTVAEAADALRISERFLRELLKRKAIPSLRIGRRVLLRAEAVDRVAREGVAP